MFYFGICIIIVAVSRYLTSSWKKTIVLPWVILLVPLLVGAGISQLNFIPKLISPWHAKTHLMVILSTISLIIGSFTTKRLNGSIAPISVDIVWNDKTTIIILLLLTGIATVSNLTEFINAGAIPLFSSDPDRARGAVATYGYIHLFSVLPGHIVPIAAIIYITGRNTLRKRTKMLVASIIIANIMLLTMWFSRGLLFFPVLTILILMYLLSTKKMLTLKQLIIFFIIIIIIVIGIKQARSYVKYGSDYSERIQAKLLDSIETSPLQASLITLYLTVAMNYEILNQYAIKVPTVSPYSGGRILTGILFSFLPGKEYGERDFQNIIIPKSKDDATLTSTFIGLPYIEFGLPGVFFASFLTGYFYKRMWTYMLTKSTPTSVLLYAYLIAMCTMMPYSFIYIRVSFIWFMLSVSIVTFLCTCKIKGTSLYYRKQKIVYSV